MNNKPRRPWLAAFLTILEIGLGHMYSGRLKRGIILFTISYLLLLALAVFLTVIVPNSYYMFFAVGISLAFIVFCIVDAIYVAKKNKEDYRPAKYNRWYMYIGYLVIAFLVWELCSSFIVAPYFIQAYKIQASSMEPNLLIGDRLLVNKRIYRTVEPERGDVVVLKYPKNLEASYVKRIIGMPGDRIEIKGRSVFVNGRSLDERYTKYIDPESIHYRWGGAYVPRKGDRILESESAIEMNGEILHENVLNTYPERTGLSNEPYSVLQDHYFVMGDNRDNSMDGRYWGSLPREYILGKASIIYWSFETPKGSYLRTSVLDRIEQLGDILVNFFSKTRWDRIFLTIE